MECGRRKKRKYIFMDGNTTGNKHFMSLEIKLTSTLPIMWVTNKNTNTTSGNKFISWC